MWILSVSVGGGVGWYVEAQLGEDRGILGEEQEGEGPEKTWGRVRYGWG